MKNLECDGKFNCKNTAEIRQDEVYSFSYYCGKCWDDVKNRVADTWGYKRIPKPHFPAEIL